VVGLAVSVLACYSVPAFACGSTFGEAQIARLFNSFWSVEQHDADPANSGTIELPESVESVLICGK